jgi:type VI secretion system protein ImpA
MDLEALMAPLSAEQPCGADISFSAEVDAIREMRREDDPSLAQGEWVAPLKTADWAGVARACETLLRTTSKDLAIAGWLTDAWARLRGFEGLSDGLVLTAALVERHWPSLHPQAEHGDQEQRIGCLVWLASRVKELSLRLALVDGGAGPMGLVEIEAARQRKAAGPDVGLDPQERGATSAQVPPPTLDAVLRAVAAGGNARFGARLEAISSAYSALLKLQAAVDMRLPDDGPSFVAARSALEQVADAWARLGRDAGVAEVRPAAPDAVAQAGASTAPASSAPHRAVPGAIQSRSQALQQLRLVADYFRHAEPHSPVAYLADKAARWGEMPLHEWLRAVVKDGMSLASFEDLLGLEPREPGG